MLDMLALIQLFRLCSEPIALHIEFLLDGRTSSPIRRTLKRVCVCLRRIVLVCIWAAAIVSQSPVFPRLFKESKVVDFLHHAVVAVVKFRVGAVHNARGPVWSATTVAMPGAEGRPVVFTMHRRRRRVGRRRRRGASRQAYQTVAGPAREPHSTLYRCPRGWLFRARD